MTADINKQLMQRKLAELQPWVELQPHQQRVADRVSTDDPRMLVYHGLGTGKCVRGWVPVFMAAGPVSIASLFSEEMPEGVTEEWQTVSGLSVLSYSPSGPVVRAVKRLYRQRLRDTEHTYRVTTLRGRVIEGTAAHKLRIYSPEGERWCQLRDLKLGDHLMAASKIDVPPCSNLPSELVELLTWQITEGHEAMRKTGKLNCIQITQKDVAVLQKLQGLFQRILPASTSGGIRPSNARCSVFTICSLEYAEILERIGYVLGHKSAKKLLPALFLSLPLDDLKTIVRAFIAAEGSVGSNVVEVSSASRGMLEQLRYILLRLGIASGIAEKRGRATNGSNIWRPYYRLTISGDDAARLKVVGIDHPEKQQKLEKLTSKTSNPNYGIYVGDLLKCLVDLDLKGALKNYLTISPGKTSCASRTAIRAADRLEDLCSGGGWDQRSISGIALRWRERTQRNIAQHKPEVLRIAAELRKRGEACGYTNDPIVRLEIGEAGGLVYDLEVDGLTDDEHSYLAGYGAIVSHNTLAAIAAAEAAKSQGGGEYGIVAPASLRDNFKKEVGKFTRGSQPEILSYTEKALGRKFKTNPGTLIFDEAHRLRNPESMSARASIEAARNSPRVALLTGSPITNHPTDLAGPLSILKGQNISPEQFEKLFVQYKKVKPGWIPWLRGVQPGEEMDVKNPEHFKAMFRGHVDYNPGKSPEGVNVNEEVIDVPMTTEQERIQKAIRTKVPPRFLWKIDQEFPLSRDELGKLNSFLTGMRQVSLSTQPFRADKNPLKAFGQSGKLQTAMQKLQEVLNSDERKKAIIYSNYIDAGLQPYAAALKQQQIPHAIFHGGVSPAERRKALDDYNAGKLRALLIGPAGAEGISTKGTSLIQLLDPHWNETRSQQAKGRGLRFDSHFGLPEELKDVAVQRFISRAKEPGWLKRLLFKAKRQHTGDEILDRLARDKEKANDKFRKLLQEVGTEQPEG